MKKIIIISLFTMIIVLIIVWFLFNKYKYIKVTDTDTNTSEEISPTPTGSLLPTPSVTLPPVASTGFYPAYKLINQEKKYGIINDKGEFIISPNYINISDYKEGVAIAYNYLNQYTVIDQKGTILFENDDVIEDFHNGAAAFTKNVGNNRFMGYIDTNGEIIIEPSYQMADSFNKDNKAYVSTGTGKYSLIDKTGAILESFELDSKYDMVVNLQDGYVLYAAQDSGLPGVVTVSGEEIFEPNYSEINYLGNDRFAVKDSSLEFYELWTAPAAIYNREGERLTDYTLYDVSDYNGDFASATDSKFTYFIGLDGKEVTTLPRMEGRGTLKMIGDIIKADIDNELYYLKKDGSILWQSDNTNYLDNGISIKSLKFKPNKYVLVFYPQVEGLADLEVQILINEQLENLFTEVRNNLKEEDMLSVEDSFSAELMNNLLIINRKGYDYPLGAAHGMPIRDYYYIDIKTGDFYQLSDLFLEGSNYVETLTAKIKSDIEKQIQEKDTMLFPESFDSISENQGFIITKDALIIYFTPYEIAAYAAGFPEFEIPFEELMDLINTNGDFWKSFH